MHTNYTAESSLPLCRSWGYDWDANNFGIEKKCVEFSIYSEGHWFGYHPQIPAIFTQKIYCIFHFLQANKIVDFYRCTVRFEIYAFHTPTYALFINLVKSFKITLKYTILITEQQVSDISPFYELADTSRIPVHTPWLSLTLHCTQHTCRSTVNLSLSLFAYFSNLYLYLYFALN